MSSRKIKIEDAYIEGMTVVFGKTRLQKGKKTKPIWGTRPWVKNSKVSMKKHYKMFFEFLCLKGDYYSLLMMQHEVPLDENNLEFCPSMDPQSLREYLMFKCYGQKGSPVLNSGGHIVEDIFEKAIICTQSWNCDSNLMQFMASSFLDDGVGLSRFKCARRMVSPSPLPGLSQQIMVYYQNKIYLMYN